MLNQFKKKMAKADHSSWPSQVFLPVSSSFPLTKYLIKGGISGQIDKNKSYKGYKVRQQQQYSGQSERASKVKMTIPNHIQS
jgi:spore germination protein GerM